MVGACAESHVTELLEGKLTERIIRAFYRVYDRLGFGFLESVYCEALAIELDAAGVEFRREAKIDVFYGGRRIGHYKADFLVEDRVVVEVKSTEVLAFAHQRQLLNGLRASSKEVGLLLHFGPKPVFKRLVHSNPSMLAWPN